MWCIGVLLRRVSLLRSSQAAFLCARSDFRSLNQAEKKDPIAKSGPLFFTLAPRPGLEPGTYGLTVRRSTD
ncbi:MAG: hypothetical protein RJB60_116 [Pseudomonadota bacterium]|jgi:hypothetical protein